MLKQEITRYAQNLSIITQLKKGKATPEALKQYSGWGGLRETIYQPAIYAALKAILTPDEIKSLKQTLKNAYYTPPVIVRFMYEWLLQYGFTGGNILEPSIGHGVFVEHMPPKLMERSHVTAVEMDSLTSQITKHLYPHLELYACGFEQFQPESKFDLIIGNPPYGANTIYDSQHPDLKEYCIHHYFVAKSMRLLKTGGILAMVLPSYFMDNTTKNVRTIIHNEGGDLITAYRLPDDFFADAKITIDIVFLIKGKTGSPWLRVKDICVSGIKKPINEFFYHQGSNIFGNLELINMYQRKALTCKRRGNVAQLLAKEIKSIKLKNFIKQHLVNLDKQANEAKVISEMLKMF